MSKVLKNYNSIPADHKPYFSVICPCYNSKPGYSKSEVGLGNVANIDQSKAIKSITRSGTTFTATALDNSTFTFTQQDNNTTYSANNGVGLSGTTFYNSGVRSIGTGTANGTISVNTNGSAANVSVKGLGTAAYTNSTAYAAASHTHSYLPLNGGIMSGDITMSSRSIWDASRIKVEGVIAGLSTGDLYLLGNGNVTVVNDAGSAFRPVYASAFTVASSKSIKENIHPMTDTEAKKLLDVNIVSFDYKKEVGGEKNNYGVIAEELNEIIPYACNMKDESREVSMSNISSVDYSKLVPYLIKMIQIQQKEIDELKK